MTDLKKIYSIRFKQIHSTNVWIKEHASSLAPNHITCITADTQTAGRGRFGKPWISPKGNVYSSLFFSVPKGVSYLSNISQILSYSAVIALEKLEFAPKIKWPNDLQLEGKKVAGVLTETVHLNDRLGVVVGIGLNVNMTADALQIVDQPATSLAIVSGKQWNIEEIMASILEEFRQSLFILEKEGFAPFQAAFEERLAYKGEIVQCQKGTTLLEGICHSITRDGSLNLLLPSGDLEILSSGEIQNLRRKT
ncbi:MAG TPA: biotin--[acetyl-CoA-carboxylase] ligase [Rhabdochlamydiaceae bacterium]|nr:biotin--[acetyl-CoA-carboxylase] ligase [Rhabdochlamydiaceae bacterium]